MKLPFEADLKGKTAVITGGGGVLCSKFAMALAACGAKVAVLDLKEESAKKVAAQIVADGGEAIGIETNVLQPDSVSRARDIIMEKYGKCDILINGAGGNHPKGTTTKEYYEPGDIDNKELNTFFDMDVEGVGFVFNLNFLGTLIPSQVFAKDMADNTGKVIINISSMSAFTSLTKVPAYSAAKAAVSNFTQWLAVHFSKVGIRVNAIAPGFFVTDQNRALLVNEAGEYTERSKKILSKTPMNRFGDADELLGALLFLVSHQASSFVNGVVLPVDGGFDAYSGV